MNRLLIVAGLVSALLPAGCGRHKPKPAMPPLQVETARAVTDSIPNRMSFIGYLSSNFDAVIQPRINGFLLSKRFSNGMPVKRRAAAFHDRPRPAFDHDARRRSRAPVGQGAGAGGSEQLRARRAAGQDQRHQSGAARSVYGAVQGRRSLGALGRADAQQRPHERRLHRAALAHRRHHRAHGGARGRLRGSRHAVQRADEHFEYRHADRRCGHSDGRIPQGGRRTRFDLRQRGAALGHSPDAGRRHALPLRGTLRLHAQGRVEQHGNARCWW